MPLSNGLRILDQVSYVVLLPRNSRNCYGLGFSPFARHYLGNHGCFLFLWVLRCFSSPRSLSLRNIPTCRDGLPHSEISGSWSACLYPELFAACHVLHRLQMPRHPPYILLFFLLSLLELNLSVKLDMNNHIKSTKLIASSRYCVSLQHVNITFKTNDLPRFWGRIETQVIQNSWVNHRMLVENVGFEPTTPCLQSRCSSQLS